ncbi:MAG: amidohydrolase family protein [Burkholderiales bacterium]|nr:amidohydrolase family protein [Burkholderiales bacterium]
MSERKIDRRTVLKAATALAATGLTSGLLFAQSGSGGREPNAARSAKALPGRGEFVIRGATILTMDAGIGDFARGDVYVRDGVIIAVAKDIVAPTASSIDARGMICMPGFIDTHWHLWTSVCRPIIRIDDPKIGYFPVTNRLGPHYTPEDSYCSVRLGLSEALSAGATTVHNWAHNIVTPEHADAELRAMRDMGVRGRFSYGPAQGMPNDKPMDLEGLAKTKRAWMPNDGMLTMGICSRNVGADANLLRGNIPMDIVKTDWGGARALGLPITLHTSGPSPIRALNDAGMLGPDVQLVHPLLTTAEERQILKERGVSYSMSPVGESRRPASSGVIQLAELLEAGVKVSMSIDHTGSYNVDFFQCMRFLYNLHQHRVGARVPLTSKRLVQLATLDGAVDLGIADRTGSLTPGKRADIILVRTGDINVAPVGDPYEALVSFAQPGNVDTVIVDGRVMRRAGRFTALDHAEVLKEAAETASALLARMNKA